MIADKWKKLQAYIATRVKLGGTLPLDGYITGVAKHIHDDQSVAQAGAALVTLHTYTLPANALKNDRDYLDIIYGGSTGVNNNNKNFITRVAGNISSQTGAFAFNGLGWIYRIRYTRLSNVILMTTINGLIGQPGIVGGAIISNGFYFSIQSSVACNDLNTNTNVIDVQAQGAAAADITQDISSIELTRLS